MCHCCTDLLVPFLVKLLIIVRSHTISATNRVLQVFMATPHFSLISCSILKV